MGYKNSMENHYYKVVAVVPKALVEDYGVWIGKHVRDMARLPCFTGSYLSTHNRPDGYTEFIGTYLMSSPDDFQDYLNKYADQMRADLPALWKQQISFQRFLGQEKSI